MKFYGTATLRGETWRVEAEAHVIVFVKRLWKRAERGNPGRVDVKNSDETCADLRWIAQRFPLKFNPEARLLAGAKAYDERGARVESILSGTVDATRFALAVQPRQYQAKSAALLLEQGHLLCADVVGLGKTCTAIAAMTEPAARPTLVVTLTHLPGQWEAQLRKFAPKLTTHIIKKATPYEIPSFFGRMPDVLIVNYHKLSGWSEFLAKHVRYVVFDEIQELRHAGTDRYVGATVVARAAVFRMGLSATPVYNYGEEIFSVLNVLKDGCVGSRREFIEEWCEPAPGGKSKLREPRAFGAWARDRGLIVRHTREEVGLELPKVISVVEEVEADTEALDRIETDAVSLAERYLATSGVSNLDKMHAADELDGLVRQATGLAKAAAVVRFVRLLVESGERVLLYGWHHAVYDAWAKGLAGISFVKFTGKETPAEKQKARDAFVAGHVDVLIMSLRAGAGLDGLQEASNVVVFGEIDWSPGVHEQCIGRLNRDGQGKGVLAYYLTTNTGSDPIVLGVLGVKKEQVEGIRDPTGANALQVVESDGQRIRRLAESYLKKAKEATSAAP